MAKTLVGDIQEFNELNEAIQARLAEPFYDGEDLNGLKEEIISVQEQVADVSAKLTEILEAMLDNIT